MEYQGDFSSPEKQKMAVDIMQSIGGKVKYKKGIPVIGPSASIDIDPARTAEKLAEDSFKATVTAVCRP